MEGRRRRKLDRELDCSSSRPLKCHHMTSTSLTSPGHRPASLEDLPEDLLHKVISGLTVKEAGRTSILSSRWRKCWTYHSNLCFDGTRSEFADTDKFVDHVNTVLQQHSRMTVDRFELRSPALGKEENAHHLDRWVGFATATKARHVTLDFSPLLHSKNRIVRSPIKYKLPTDRLVCSGKSSSNFTIVSLFLGYVCLELPPVVSDGSRLLGFKTLKKLELESIVDLGDLTPFIANCPALECLSISNSSIHHLVVPQACCLRYLRLERVSSQSIHLNSTSLTTFEYLRSPSVPIKTNTTLKLSQANIHVYQGLDTVSYFWDELSCWLAHVYHLVLTLSMDTKVTRLINDPTKFIHLRYLKLFCNILLEPESALVILRLTQIIESAQQLEHFVLHMHSFDFRPLILKTPNSIHPHVHHHLKTVQMTGVVGLPGQLELAKYILLSADALEFMTLNLERYRIRHVLSKSDYIYFTTLEEFARNYLDPQGVYHDVFKIVGL